MTVSYVTLVLDEGLPDGSLITDGCASIALSARVALLGGPIYGTGPVVREFSQFGSPVVNLAPNDTFGPQLDTGPGTAYTITYDSDVPGAPAQWTFQLLSTGGTTQRLSQLAPVEPGTTWQSYLPLSGGVLLGGLAPGVVPLADAATVTPAGGLGNDFRLNMTTAISTREIAAAVPLADGQVITMILRQPAGGGCLVTWDPAYNWGDLGQPVVKSGSRARTVLAFKYDASQPDWLYQGSAGYL